MQLVVVIVNYNSTSLLQRCLSALRRQTRVPDKIVVVDNASTDPKVLPELTALGQIEVIYNLTNQGYGAAINRACQDLAQDDLLICLNPDAFPEPGCLAALETAADEYPEVGSFATLMLNADNPHIIDGAGDLQSISGHARRRGHGKLRSTLQLADGKVFAACGGACLYRVSAFRHVGGFDESYFMYSEDSDLGFRLQMAGFSCRFVSTAVVHHQGSATTGGYGSDFCVFHGNRNVVWLTVKNFPSVLLPLAALSHVVIATLLALQMLVLGQLGVFLRGKWAGVRQMGGAWRARKTVQRRVSIGYLMRNFSWP